MTTTENEQRDGLVSLLWCKPFPYGGAGAYMRPDANASHAMAETILAAGYRKPRIITTREELDALPDESIVLTGQGCYWQADKRGHEEIWWLEPGNPLSSLSESLTLPATVIHEPEAERRA